jgi:hypothetical protein
MADGSQWGGGEGTREQGEPADRGQEAEEILTLTVSACEGVAPHSAIPEALVTALADLLLADLLRVPGEQGASAAKGVTGTFG